MKKTSCQYLAAFGLEHGRLRVVAGALLSLILAVAGCSRDAGETPREPSPTVAEPTSYMEDASFRTALAEKRKERNQLVATRDKLVAKLEKMAAEMRGKMPGADDDAVRQALEKDPEWNSLVARVAATKEAFDDNRAATLRKVRDRMGVTQQKISR